LFLFVLGAILYALHQDFWLWREARPLVFGFLPAGLAYHGAYTLIVAGFMAALCRFAWPLVPGSEEGPED
jgi:hypothetical protein